MVSSNWSQYRGSLGGGGGQGDMHRRLRNRTITGLESMRMPGGMDHLRPGSAQGRPITPSFSNDKDPGQTFIDFNPAGNFFLARFQSRSSFQRFFSCFCYLYFLNFAALLRPGQL